MLLKKIYIYIYIYIFFLLFILKNINFEVIFSLYKLFICFNLKNSTNIKDLFKIINQNFEKVFDYNIITEEDYLNFKISFCFIIIYFIEKKRNGEEDNEFRIWFNVYIFIFKNIIIYIIYNLILLNIINN